MEKIEGSVVSNTVFQEIILIKDQIERVNDIKPSSLSIPGIIKVNRIEPHEFTDPLEKKSSDRRGKKEPLILKKLLKQTIDVAYIPTLIPKDNTIEAEKFQDQLAVIGKLRAPNILRFYGFSYVDNQPVKVFEWAEYGNLREVYNTYDISWTTKVNGSVYFFNKRKKPLFFS